MKALVNYTLSAIYALYFILAILIFHPIQMLAFHAFGRRAHQRSVHVLNFFLLYGVSLLGCRVRYKETVPLPTDRPLIFVANHQSMFDIIGMIWYLRKNFPIFVSKIEIAKGIPSISYNLQKSGAALIDRKDSRQAISEIVRLGKLIEETGFSAAIFPEGTRSRSGMKPFAVGGLGALLKKAPSAWVVPVAIDGTGSVDAFKGFPLRAFGSMSWTSLPPIDPKGKKAEDVVAEVEAAIKAVLAPTPG